MDELERERARETIVEAALPFFNLVLYLSEGTRANEG